MSGLGLNRNQLRLDRLEPVLGNHPDNLPVVLGQLFERDGELLGAQGATFEDLLSEAAEDVRVGAVEADTVLLLGDLAILLIHRLLLVELDNGTGGPSRVAAQLRFDVIDNHLVHGTSVDKRWPVSRKKSNNLHFPRIQTPTQKSGLDTFTANDNPKHDTTRCRCGTCQTTRRCQPDPKPNGTPLVAHTVSQLPDDSR